MMMGASGNDMQRVMTIGLLFAVLGAARAADDIVLPPAGMDESALEPGASLRESEAIPTPSYARGDTRMVDRWHDYILRSITHSVEYFDHFFGDQRLNDDNAGTRAVLRLGVKMDRLNQTTFSQNFSVRLALPNLSHNLQIIADNMFDVGTPNEARAFEDAFRAQKPDTGLRYIFTETKQFRINADAGLQFGTPTRFFAKLRGRYTITRDPWEIRLAERVQWYSRDGFGENSEISWSRKLSDGALFRFQNDLDWLESQRGLRPSTAVSYYRLIDWKSSWKTTLRAAWPEAPLAAHAIYGNDVTYRRLIHSDWLYFETTPGIEWREQNGFGWNPYVYFVFEIDFEKEARRPQ
jgi:hypothetical protein